MIIGKVIKERKIMANSLKEKVAELIESDFIAYHYDVEEMIETLKEIKEYINFSLNGLYTEKREWEEWDREQAKKAENKA